MKVQCPYCKIKGPVYHDTDCMGNPVKYTCKYCKGTGKIEEEKIKKKNDVELTREQKLNVLKRELKFAKKLESDRFKFFNKTKGKLACESWLERKYIVEVLKEKIGHN